MHRVVFSIKATCNAAFKLGQNKYVRFREAHFHHKFEKGNSDFLSHNSDFFNSGGKLRLSELYNSYTQRLILTRLQEKFWIVKEKTLTETETKNWIAQKKSQNWKINNCLSKLSNKIFQNF